MIDALKSVTIKIEEPKDILNGIVRECQTSYGVKSAEI